jgi:hypothetical protein
MKSQNYFIIAAFSSFVFRFITQPHSLHWLVSFNKLGHSSHTDIRLLASSSDARSAFGFRISQGRVSPNFFLYSCHGVSGVSILLTDSIFILSPFLKKNPAASFGSQSTTKSTTPDDKSLQSAAPKKRNAKMKEKELMQAKLLPL